MVKRLAAEQSGLDEDAQIGDNLLLTGEIVESERTQGTLEVFLRRAALLAYVEILPGHNYDKVSQNRGADKIEGMIFSIQYCDK